MYTETISAYSEVDDFLPSYEKLRRHCDNLNYDGITNPVDGIFYPGISIDIPTEIQQEVLLQLEELHGEPVRLNYMFLRRTLAGTEMPHQVHSDDSMGQFTLILYLNRPENCQGGTSLVQHLNGMYCTPTDDYGIALWQRDQDKPEQWNVYHECEMRSNVGFVFASWLLHRAEPIGGFGQSNKDGRLILACFYTLG